MVVEARGGLSLFVEALYLSYRFSGLWKGIVSIYEEFCSHISFQIGSGDHVFFWLDTWVGDRPLAMQFPDLFRCVRDSQATVKDYMERDDLQIF